MFQNKEGLMPGNVGDMDEVSPDNWDCFQCTASIDQSGLVGKVVECPGCGAEYEIKSEAQRVTRMDVQMTKRGPDEPCLRLSLGYNYGGYKGELLL